MRGGVGGAGVVLLVLLGSCSGPPPPPPAPPPTVAGAPPEIDRITPLPSPLPDIAARVNGQPVMLAQVVALASKGLIQSREREKDKPGLVRQAMHQYIIRELLFQEALARGLAADDHHLEEAYDKARLDFRDDKKWAHELAQRGLDPQSFRSELRVQETVNALVGQEAAKVPPVSDEEAGAAFKANPDAFGRPEYLRVRHILVGVVPTATASDRKLQRERAEGLRKRAAGGEDFVRLAQQFSDDADTRQAGGLIPNLARGMRGAPFEEAASALKPGEVSPVLEMTGGFEIIKLEEKHPAEPASFPKDKGAIEQKMLQQRRGIALQALVNSLRAKAKIETYL